MSLSKIYTSSDTFQPDEVVQDNFKEDEPWKKTPRKPERSRAIRPPQPPSVPQQVDNEPQVQNAESSPETAGQAHDVPKPAQPAVAPGISEDEVQRIAAEAHEQGILEGMKKAEEDYGSATRAMMVACKQLDELREVILKNSIGEMQELVLAISEKIIRQSVKHQKETIIRTVDEAIAKAVKSEQLAIFVNPDDYDTVTAKSESLVASLSGLTNILVKKDSTVELGGCRIESDNCTVDASLISQLEIVSDWVKNQE